MQGKEAKQRLLQPQTQGILGGQLEVTTIKCLTLCICTGPT